MQQGERGKGCVWGGGGVRLSNNISRHIGDMQVKLKVKWGPCDQAGC